MPTSFLKHLGPIAALTVMLAGTCFQPLEAVTPDVSLPAWHTLEVRVSEWNPAKGEACVVADLRGLGMPLSGLAAELHWPEPVRSGSGRMKSAGVAAGESWKTKYTASNITPPFDGWIELEMLARPDSGAVRKAVENISTYTPGMRLVMMGEVAALKDSIAIGRSLAFYADQNMAVLMPGALAFKPVLKTGSRPLHLWTPEAASEGPLKQALSKLRASVGTENPTTALDEAIKAVDEAMGIASDAVEIASADGKPPFTVPLNVFRDGMTMNRAVLAAAREPGSTIALGRIERIVRQAPNFTTAFGWANVGVLQAEAGLTERSRESLREALSLIPAWPLVRGWLKDLEKVK